MIVSEVYIDIKDALLFIKNLLQRRSWRLKPQVDSDQEGSIELQNFDQ